MPGRRHVGLLVLAVVTLLSIPSAAEAEFEDPGAANPDVTIYSPVFEDVPVDHLFAGPIRAMLAAGVTVGCDITSTRFCPDRTITRGEMAAFITRALQLPEGTPTDFTDDNGHTFENAIQRIAAAGITRGCNPPANDRFCPDRTITRGEMAAFMTRAIDTLTVPPEVPPGITIERVASANRYEIAFTVCREKEESVMVRSVVGAVPGYAHLKNWEPSSASIPGELDGPTDRWFLPTASGCEILEATWNPRTNVLVNPVDVMDLVSPFGPRRHPIFGGIRLHAGIDLKGEPGDPIYAAGSGVVSEAGDRGGYGQMVDIEHPGGLLTRYAHLSSIATAVGTTVSAGDLIGHMGCSGLCTGPHLHFETREFEMPVDPLIYLP